MILSQISVKKILCPVDFSEQSLQVVDHAIRVSDVFSEAKIMTLNVVDDMAPEYISYRTTDQRLKTLHRTLEQDSQNRFKQHVSPKFRGLNGQDFMTAFGKPPDMITRISKEQRIDLIMIATRNQGLTTQFILGSTTYRIVRTAPCPLLVFSHPERKFRAVRLLFPTDFSEISMQALPYVYQFAREYDSDLHIVHFRQIHGALPKEPTREIESLRRNAMANGVHRVFTNDNLEGRSPGVAIIQYAKDNNIDMTVLSAHGASGYKQFFLGTTAVEVSSRSNCPVLLVRRKDWAM